MNLLSSRKILSVALLAFCGFTGYAVGQYVANYERITENPLYNSLLYAGVEVNIDGFLCKNQEYYGLFDSETNSISLCLSPHSSNGESVQSTLRHEAWHVLQACYNSKNKVKVKGSEELQGLPDGQGVFFTPEEYNSYFGVDGGPRSYLSKDKYEEVLSNYSDEKESSELEAASAETYFADQVIANWIDTYCQEVKS